MKSEDLGMKVVVIGGGPSGMMAAITAKQNGHQVILLEKMKSLGRKLLITGKGRCNITSSLDMGEFIKNTPNNGKFLYSCYQNYTNQDIIQFLKEQGLEVKEERGNRIFPVTDKSEDVLKCFTKKLKTLDVEIRYETQVTKIVVEQKGDFTKVRGVETEYGSIEAEKIILATGGKSYPLTGSTGDGYQLAKSLGHTITKIRPSLVPLKSYDKDICQRLQGLSLKNVRINLIDTKAKKVIYQDFGEMLFTHFGVSGPIILSSSAHLVRYKEIEEKLKNHFICLVIDLKPALSEEKLNERVMRDFQEGKNKQFKNSLDKLLPQKMIPVVIERSSINPNKLANEITREERQRLVKLLKNFRIEIEGPRPIQEAIITNGGICTKEINPKTMQSKKVDGLYFAGEIIDVDSYTGGFNLQIAYSTGYTAGLLRK